MDKATIAALKKTVQNEAKRREGELLRRTAEGTAGGGLVKAHVDGFGSLRALTIDPEAFNGRDADLLADLVMSAVAEAQRRAEEMDVESSAGTREPNTSAG